MNLSGEDPYLNIIVKRKPHVVKPRAFNAKLFSDVNIIISIKINVLLFDSCAVVF